MTTDQGLVAFWSLPAEAASKALETDKAGLSEASAAKRLVQYGPNTLKTKKRQTEIGLFLNQFKSPTILLLILVAVISFFLGDPVDTYIILLIVFISGVLGFWQEQTATQAVEKLVALVKIQAKVIRSGKEKKVNIEAIVPGDLVVLSAGGTVPGDCLVLEEKDLFIDEAALTGETFPAEKKPGQLPVQTVLAKRTNAAYMGTHVISGTATALVIRTGLQTEFGKISATLAQQAPITEFERGTRKFGFFLLQVTLLLVIAIFAINVYLARPVLDSLLFSLALAVGLTPQLLPAIISINLAHGAKRMAKKKVIVKRLASIENFGSMTVFCSDKTGTLTEGGVRLKEATDYTGQAYEKVLRSAYLIAAYEAGFSHPVNQAIRTEHKFPISGYKKLDELPFDSQRNRLSILVRNPDGQQVMLTKGPFKNVLPVCTKVETAKGSSLAMAKVRAKLEARFRDLSQQGFRVQAVAAKPVSATHLVNGDEAGLALLGLLVFYDPPKAGIKQTIERLRAHGVILKVITGDNALVAASLTSEVGFDKPRLLTGAALHKLSDDALLRQINDIDVFAEVEPDQKERILLSLRKAGNVVGYIGDGINDGLALHTADVGISVESAVDVAKEAADIVLLKKDLNVLLDGIEEGRITFANTLKYIFMATSANFGNMFSMAGASIFLPFLPLLPKQILLTNLLTDLPEMAIATDHVDHEFIAKPRRWNIHFIRHFMLTFGLVSSIFDYLTFGVLMLVLHSSPTQFRSGWFIESVVSAALVVLIIRTRRPFFQSKPSRPLLWATLGVAVLALLVPFSPLAIAFGFAPVPPIFLVLVSIIVLLYILVAELAKAYFYRHLAANEGYQ